MQRGHRRLHGCPRYVCDANDRDGVVDLANGQVARCAAPHATGVCRGGACPEWVCDARYTDVNSSVSDGCERGCSALSVVAFSNDPLVPPEEQPRLTMSGADPAAIHAFSGALQFTRSNVANPAPRSLDADPRLRTYSNPYIGGTHSGRFVAVHRHTIAVRMHENVLARINRGDGAFQPPGQAAVFGTAIDDTLGLQVATTPNGNSTSFMAYGISTAAAPVLAPVSPGPKPQALSTPNGFVVVSIFGDGATSTLTAIRTNSGCIATLAFAPPDLNFAPDAIRLAYANDRLAVVASNAANVGILVADTSNGGLAFLPVQTAARAFTTRPTPIPSGQDRDAAARRPPRDLNLHGHGHL